MIRKIELTLDPFMKVVSLYFTSLQVHISKNGSIDRTQLNTAMAYVALAQAGEAPTEKRLVKYMKDGLH